MRSSYGTGGATQYEEDEGSLETQGLLTEDEGASAFSSAPPPSSSGVALDPTKIDLHEGFQSSFDGPASAKTPLKVRVKNIKKGRHEFVGSFKPHQVFRLLWLVLICLSTLIGVPILVLRLYKIESEIRLYLLSISTVFVVLAGALARLGLFFARVDPVLGG